MIVMSFSLLLTACTGEEHSFFPLSSGHTLHYDVTKTTMDGTFGQKYIIETLSETNWQGTASVPMVSAGGEQYLYQRSGAAIYRVAFKSRDAVSFVAHASPHLVLPQKLQLGSAWQQATHTKLLENTGPPWETLFKIVQPVDLEFTVDALDVAVTVPAGIYQNCLKVSGFGETNVDVGNYIGRTVISVEVEQWYARGIGLVKSLRTETTTADAISKGTLAMELEYSVK